MDAYPLLLILLLLFFVALMASGLPIAFCLGRVGVLFGLISIATYQQADYGPRMTFPRLEIMGDNVWSLAESKVLIAVPLFIFMGLMLDRSGMAERMMRSMQQLFGRLKGGLALTVVLIGVILAASTGIIGASVVLLGQ